MQRHEQGNYELVINKSHAIEETSLTKLGEKYGKTFNEELFEVVWKRCYVSVDSEEFKEGFKVVERG